MVRGVVRGAHELKDDLANGIKKTVQQVRTQLKTFLWCCCHLPSVLHLPAEHIDHDCFLLQVEKELLALFVTNVKQGSRQQRTYIFLSDAAAAVLYCLEVDNYKTWQLQDGYNQIFGRIMHSRLAACCIWCAYEQRHDREHACAAMRLLLINRLAATHG